MRFLNVYPIKLWATSTAPDVFEGKLSFTLEQYGLMFNENTADITLARDPEKPEAWRLWVKPLHGVDVPYCIDVIGGPYMETRDAFCKGWRPKTALKSKRI